MCSTKDDPGWRSKIEGRLMPRFGTKSTGVGRVRGDSYR
jgi:hypothetical protein